ncbi:MAG: redoxin domain-containing protein [Bacteroidales bacterium]|nr:redoxin domain-containing protein [Bacteroidales bacterium]
MKSNAFVLSALALLVVVADLAGQVIKVAGAGEGYASEKIEVFLLSDPITARLNPVTVVKCDSAGSFAFEIPATERYTTLYLKSGTYMFKILVSAGKEYNVSLPPFVPIKPEDSGNPFFSPATLIPFVTNDSADINNLAGQFDKRFFEVMTGVAERVANKTKLNEIPRLLESLNTVTGLSEDKFYRDYVTFRMIMLNAVSYGEYPGRKEDSVMINMRFYPENPAYTDLIGYLFRDYFRVLLSGPEARHLEAAIKKSSLAGCEEVFLKDGKIVNRELGHYVVLLNMYNGFYNGLFDAGILSRMLDSAATNGATRYIRDLASTLKENVFRMKKGSPLPQFSLPDTSGKVVTPATYRDKYLLIVFIGGTGQETLSELSLLKSWYEKYREKLALAVIVAGDEYGKISGYFRQRGYRWNFLDASGAPFITNQFEIRLLPGFVLADPEGRLAEDYCPLPSENLEGLIARLKGPG